MHKELDIPSVTISRACPCCGERMSRFVPIVYSGDKAFDYRCINDNCPAQSIHLIVREK